MATARAGLWYALERRSPRLFLLAGVVLFVGATNYGIAALFAGVAFTDWLGAAVLLGRLVSLLAVAGLTARVAVRDPGVGTLIRAVVVLAVLFTAGAPVGTVLADAAVTAFPVGGMGLGAVVLTVVAYTLLGSAVVRAGSDSPLVGWLLLLAAVGLLSGFFALMAFPEGRLDAVGAVTEVVLSVTHLAIGYRLRAEEGPTDRTGPPSEAVPE
jgi:hypothetical protein